MLQRQACVTNKVVYISTESVYIELHRVKETTYVYF